MLLLLEAPFIKEDYGEAIWVTATVSYFPQSNTYSYAHHYLPYAAAISIDCIERKVVNIRKHIQGIYTKELPNELIEKLIEKAIPFDESDKTWAYRLRPERINDDSPFPNVNRRVPKPSKLFNEFLESIVSKGLPSTGLRGNVNSNPDSQNNSDDESCETC